MSIEISFQPDDLTGLVAEGTLVRDAAKRMGVRLPADCDNAADLHNCAVTVTRGAELLSPLTAIELKHLTDAQRAAGERLSCQTRIERTGTVAFRIAPEVEKVEENTAKFRKAFGKLTLSQKTAFAMELERSVLARQPVPITGDEVESEFRREFNELPLQRKLGALAELEGAAAIHGVISVANLPFTIGEKVMDVMAGRGYQMDRKDPADAPESAAPPPADDMSNRGV